MLNIFIGFKKFGWVFYNRGDTWKRQRNRFERERRNRNVNYSASNVNYSASIRDARSLRLKYSPCVLLPAFGVIAEIIAGPGRAHTFNVMLETHHALSVWGKTFKTLAWLLPYL